MAGDPCFALPSDRVHRASVTLSGGAAASDYPLTNLHDADPSTLFMLASAVPFRVTVNRGTSGAFGFAALFNHNLDAGLACSILTGSNAGLSADLTTDFLTIPADREDEMPVSPFVNLTARTNKYVALEVTGTNSLAPAIGELWVTDTLRTLSPISSFRWGLQERESRVTKQAQSDIATGYVYDYSLTRRFLTAEFHTTQEGIDQLRMLWRSVKGNVSPWVWVPDREVNEAWLVRFTNELEITYDAPDWFQVNLVLEEVSGGVPPRMAAA